MLHIKDKKDCCGCFSCVQKCPKHCIMLTQDEQGFLYPEVNTTNCIECGLCERVCPILTAKQSHEPLKVFAAKNPEEEIRKKSSSGGVFTMLAENIVQEGGVVFGARWDENWNVVHDYTETLEGIKFFRGSKYVQSNINENYKQAEAFLKEGRKVLFSGTPCQIAGLKAFLQKENDNLITVEVACHGVPSPMVWTKYLNEVIAKRNIVSINEINFRNKKYGWNSYHFSIDYINHNGKLHTMIHPHGDNPFYRGFLNHLYIRPSCYDCKSKGCASGADITIADFWGIDKLESTLDDDKGYSTLLANTVKGLTTILLTCGELPEYPYREIIKHNPALINSLKKTSLSDEFWKSKDCIVDTVERLCGDSLILRLKKQLSKLIHNNSM